MIGPDYHGFATNPAGNNNLVKTEDLDLFMAKHGKEQNGEAKGQTGKRGRGRFESKERDARREADL